MVLNLLKKCNSIAARNLVSGSAQVLLTSVYFTRTCNRAECLMSHLSNAGLAYVIVKISLRSVMVILLVLRY